MTTASRKNIYILAFTLLVVMLGYGMVMPVMPFLIEKLGAGGTELGWLVSTYSLMQLVCAPLWGMLSDRTGRKPIIAIGILGYALTMFLFGLATRFWMLFLARTLAGMLSSAAMPTAMAYISDNSAEKERSGGMGQLGGAIGVGVVAGPLLGGLLSKRAFALPFFVGAGLAALAFLLVLLLLPESPPAPQDTKKQPLPWQDFRRVFSSPAGLLLLLIFIMSFGLANFQGIIGLYAVDKFGFNPGQVGVLWMVIGAVLILGQGGLTGPLTKRFGELPLICAGLAGGAMGFILISLAGDFTTLLLALGFFTLALALIGPALNAHISRFAGEHQGTVMGLNSACSSLGRVVGPLLAGPLFDLNIEYPLWSGAGTLLLGTFMAVRFIRNQRKIDTAGATFLT
jgi:DHA1 family multidrug resistance protein-like MFS transporter